MTNPTWPDRTMQPDLGSAALPDVYSDSDPMYTPYNNFVSSPQDVGPSKLRRRFTGTNEAFSFTLTLLPAQYTTFMNFYKTTLQEVLPFDWLDMRTGVTQTYRFNKQPVSKWVAGATGAGWWQVGIELDTVL